MTDVQRPRRVVVVDADDPLVEVRGEFFWREDHERLLSSVRELAYRDGFEQGFAAGTSRQRSLVYRMRVRRRAGLFARALAAVVAVAFLVSLVANIVR